MDEVTVKGRIDDLLTEPGAAGPRTHERAGELVQGAITLLRLAYGDGCPQIKALNDMVAARRKDDKGGSVYVDQLIIQNTMGVLASLKREVDAGLIGNLRREGAGEVLGDLLLLAKTVLDQGTESSKNVAAVLVAAAFEDTIRRLGASYCAIHTRESLPDILTKLKASEVLKGSQVGVVQSHFQFRNDAMHADWSKIDVVGVKTVIALVQELLLKHFS